MAPRRHGNPHPYSACGPRSRHKREPSPRISWNVGGCYRAGVTINALANSSGITAVAATSTAGLTAGTTQCFAVTAVEGGVEGTPSTSACAAVPQAVPGAPTQITVVLH